MKLPFALLFFGCLTASLPTSELGRTSSGIEYDLVALVKRATGTTSNELTSGPCRKIVLIFGRGTSEPGNLGVNVGPELCDGLKSHYGTSNVACQGIGAPYYALIGPNALPAGSTDEAFAEGARLFNLAASKCPSAIIVGGGYSQGAAVIHGAARRLSAAVQDRVKALVTFGDAQNAEDGGQIPPFPPAKVKIICNPGDLICAGTIIVTPAHLEYTPRVPEGTAFLVSKIGTL